MANVSVIGACGLYGLTWTACSTCVARLPKYLFNVAVMGSSSFIPVDRASSGPAAEKSKCLNQQGGHSQCDAQYQGRNLPVQTPQANIQEARGGHQPDKKTEHNRPHG